MFDLPNGNFVKKKGRQAHLFVDGLGKMPKVRWIETCAIDWMEIDVLQKDGSSLMR